jgi:tRNASer (uridine44-2'-O)-methyltransferase
VYEDCGIAAFLLELWQSQGIGPRLRFADIGCGNGLLVHLLAKEGFSGVGLDVRRRRIWSLFQAQGTDLQEVAIDPSSAQSTQEVFNGIDFLIGNHSDELTPWIPVIAARSAFLTSKYP